MSQKITPLKYPNSGVRQLAKDVDKLLTHDAALVNSKNLSSAEVEIISKISTIVTYLKSLEENFSKARQDLIKKSSLEGRENPKICAVQGKIISNAKKYYKSLEEDITVLSNSFHDQFKKIAKELDSINVLSKGKTDYKGGSSGENPIMGLAMNMFLSAPLQPESRKNSNQKIPELTTFRPPHHANPAKTAGAVKEKTLMPFILKSDPFQEVPKKLDFGESQMINSHKIARIHTVQHAPQRMLISKLQTMDNNRNSLNLSVAVPKIECVLPAEDSSLDLDVENGGQTPKALGQVLVDSSQEDQQEAVLSRKPRSLDSFLTEDRKEVSVENHLNFYI